MTRESGRTLIGVLVAVVIAIGLTLLFTNGSSLVGGKEPERADGKGETIVGRSMLAGKDTQCQNYLGQLRASIQINTDPVDNTRPQSLEETRLGKTFYNCPVGGEAYIYDPQTGKVSCPHAGHESY